MAGTNVMPPIGQNGLGGIKDPWGLFYQKIQLIRAAYKSPAIIEELVYKAFIDSAYTTSGFELRFSLVSMAGDYLNNTNQDLSESNFHKASREVLEAIIRGKERALKEISVPAALRFGLSRQPKYLAKIKMICPLAREFADEFSGLDVLGDERSSGLAPLRPFIEKLRAYLPDLTIHAGELKGPESIREALELNPDAIGHGIRSVEDSGVIDEILNMGITLEVCPTSNSTLIEQTLEGYVKHPLVTLSDRGVNIVLGTDDPEIFGTTIQQEYGFAAGLGVDISKIHQQAEIRLNEIIKKLFV